MDRPIGTFPAVLLLAAATLLALLPFAGKAFHVDDPLFLWSARQIAAQPLDPYGFTVNWWGTPAPMAAVTKNPPLVCYLIATASALFGSSEIALHLVFLLPALASVLGTYRLALRWCSRPVTAALLALFAPGFLVSATSVMCDVTMLAFWIWAIVLWVEGIDRERDRWRLPVAGLLVALAALSKYFGLCLIPLLAAYSIGRRRRLGAAVGALAIPVLVLAGYQWWTAALYGRGLLADAAQYATLQSRKDADPWLVKGAIGLAFTGGCALPALLLAPLTWMRRGLLLLGGLALAAGTAAGWYWKAYGLGSREGFIVPVGVHAGLFIAAGASVVALAVADFWRRRDADSALLALWTGGTFLFAAYVNWTVNARSVLPLIPAAAILLVRRLDDPARRGPAARAGLVHALVAVSALAALWVAWGDARLAGTQREAARVVQRRTAGERAPVWFQGHWGFQYYMESFGARALDLRAPAYASGEIVVLPGSNDHVRDLRREHVGDVELFELPLGTWLSTMDSARAAGFYASHWGPLPFTFGPTRLERYRLVRVKAP